MFVLRGGPGVRTALAIAALTCLTVPRMAAAAEVVISQGGTAAALFTTVDPSGCAFQFIGVDASQNAERNPPSGQTSDVGVLVVVTRINFCTNEGLSSVGFSSTMQFKMSPTNATLQGDVLLCGLDPSGDPFVCDDFALNLTWTGVGNVTVDHSTVRQRTQTGFFLSQTQGTSLPANAVGSLSLGDQNLITGPSAPGVTLISTATAHTVTVD